MTGLSLLADVQHLMHRAADHDEKVLDQMILKEKMKHESNRNSLSECEKKLLLLGVEEIETTTETAAAGAHLLSAAKTPSISTYKSCMEKLERDLASGYDELTVADARLAEAKKAYELAMEQRAAAAERVNGLRGAVTTMGQQRAARVRAGTLQREIGQHNIGSSTERLGLLEQLQRQAKAVRQSWLGPVWQQEVPDLADGLVQLFKQSLPRPRATLTNGSDSAALLSARVALEAMRLWQQLCPQRFQPPAMMKLQSELRELLGDTPRPVDAQDAQRVKRFTQATVVLHFDRVQHITPENHTESQDRVQRCIEALQQRIVVAGQTRVPGPGKREIHLLCCNDVLAPPVWCLPLVHSPVYLKALCDMSDEANKDDLFVPVEFDTEWGSDLCSWESEEEEDVEEKGQSEYGAQGSRSSQWLALLGTGPDAKLLQQALVCGEVDSGLLAAAERYEKGLRATSGSRLVYKQDRPRSGLAAAGTLRPRGRPRLERGAEAALEKSSYDSATATAASEAKGASPVDPAVIRSILRETVNALTPQPVDGDEEQEASVQPQFSDPFLHKAMLQIVGAARVQRLVADALGVHPATLSTWIHDKATGGALYSMQSKVLQWLEQYDDEGILTSQVAIAWSGRACGTSKELLQHKLLQTRDYELPYRRKTTYEPWEQDATLGSLTKRVMRSAGITQEGLSQYFRLQGHTDLTQGAVSNWLLGKVKEPQLPRYRALALQWLKENKTSMNDQDVKELEELIVWENQLRTERLTASAAINENGHSERDTPAVAAAEDQFEREEASEAMVEDVDLEVAIAEAACEEGERDSDGSNDMSDADDSSSESEDWGRSRGPATGGAGGAAVSLDAPLQAETSESLGQMRTAVLAEMQQRGIDQATLARKAGLLRLGVGRPELLLFLSAAASPPLSARTLQIARRLNSWLQRVADADAGVPIPKAGKKRRGRPVGWRQQKVIKLEEAVTSVHSAATTEEAVSSEQVEACGFCGSGYQLFSTLKGFRLHTAHCARKHALASPTHHQLEGEADKGVDPIADIDRKPLAPEISSAKRLKAAPPALLLDSDEDAPPLVRADHYVEGHHHSSCELCRSAVSSSNGRFCGSCPLSYHFSCSGGKDSTACNTPAAEGQPAMAAAWHCERCRESGACDARRLLPAELSAPSLAGQWLMFWSAFHRRWRLAYVISAASCQLPGVLIVKWWRSDNRGGKTVQLDVSWHDSKILLASSPDGAAEALARAKLHRPGDSTTPRQAKVEPLPQPDAMFDTYVGGSSLEAALCAAGCACRAVDIVMCGENSNVFSCTRPPGHHAGRCGCTSGCLSTGFCLLNNAAIATVYSRVRWGLQRVAVVDIDVHFGNGTASILKNDPGAFFASVHMIYGANNRGASQDGEGAASAGGPVGEGFYPATLGATEITPNYVSVGVAPAETRYAGRGKQKGEAALPPSSPALLRGAEGYRTAIRSIIVPQLLKYRPELLIISAGFDGFYSDPLGGELCLSLEDYAWSTQQLMACMDELWPGNGKVLSLLEGGYDVSPLTNGLARCVVAHVEALAGLKEPF